MDMHVHITANNPYRTPRMGVPGSFTGETTALRALRGAFVAEQFLQAGFTTIKEIGNDANYASADVIKAIKEGWVEGPTIYYAGKIIAPFGGQSRGVSVEKGDMWAYEYIDADSPDEIVKAVRQNIYYGADVIKMVTGDNGIYNVEDIRAAVDEAAKYSIKVNVHAMGGLAAQNVILGGAAAIEHGHNLTDDQLRLMKEKDIFLVGTDLAFDNWYAYGLDSAVSQYLTNNEVDRLRRAYKIGTKMAFGTDIIIDLPGLNHVESSLKVLETWEAAEIPPAYILQTMTIYAAELLGDEKTGALEPDFAADIVAVKSNPLKDINAIKYVHFVMKKGNVVKEE
jgi:imidazolonepropionase-like amidohydrolase